MAQGGGNQANLQLNTQQAINSLRQFNRAFAQTTRQVQINVRQMNKAMAQLSVPRMRGGSMRPGFQSNRAPHVGPGFGANQPQVIRGQIMPERSEKSARALLKLSSAAQGTMLAMSALDGSVTGLGFGLIFLGYGQVKTAALFAALTTAVVGTHRAMSALYSSALSVGTAFETSGQQMASWLKSGVKAMEIMQQASSRAANTGVFDRQEYQRALFDLEKLGLRSEEYIKALENAAVANGETLTQVTGRFTAILLADNEQREELIKKFAKDYNIEIKKYGNTLELARALNDRFAGSVENMATTTTSLITRAQAVWDSFLIRVGVVLNSYVKPIIEVVIELFRGMVRGFEDMYMADQATGEFNKRLQSFTQALRELIPYAYQLGYVIGKVVYKSIVLTAQIVKVMASALIWLWNKMKPIIDAARALIKWIKSLVSDIINWYKHNKELIDTLAFVLLGLWAFNTAVGLATGLVAGLIKMVLGLVSALLSIPLKTIDILMGKDIKKHLQEIKDQIDALKGKTVAVTVVGGEAPVIDTANIQAANRELGTLHQIIKDISDAAGRLKTKFDDLAIRASESGMKWWEVGLRIGSSFAGGLAAALAASLSAPAILIIGGILAAALVTGFVIAFPRETGNILNAIAQSLLIATGSAAILLAAQAVAMAAMFIYSITGAIRLYAESLVLVGVAIAKGLSDTVKGILDGLVNVFWGIVTGDLARVAEGATQILYNLLLGWHINISKRLFEAFMQIATDIVPRGLQLVIGAVEIGLIPFKLAWDAGLSKVGEAIAHWAVELWRGFLEPGLNATIQALKWMLQNVFLRVWDESLGKMGLVGMVANAFSWIDQFLQNWGINIPDIFRTLKNHAINAYNFIVGLLNNLPFVDVPKAGGGSSSGGGSAPSIGSSSNGTYGGVGNPYGTFIGSGFTPSIGGSLQGANAMDQAIFANYGYKVPTSATRVYIFQGTDGNGKWFWNVYDMNSQGFYSYSGVRRESPSAAKDNPMWVDDRGFPKSLVSKMYGGRVPGAPGSPQLIMAHGGEYFGGHPTFARGRGTDDSLASGVTLNVKVEIRDSVIDNDTASRHADIVAEKIMQRISGNRGMSFHRIGG